MNLRSFTLKTSHGIYTTTNVIIDEKSKETSEYDEKREVMVLTTHKSFNLVSIYGNKRTVLHECKTEEFAKKVLDFIWGRLTEKGNKNRFVDISYFV